MPFQMLRGIESHVVAVTPADGQPGYASDTGRLFVGLSGTWRQAGCGAGVAVANPAALATTETAGSTYTATEQSMLAHLKADVAELRAQLVALLASLRTPGTIET